MKTFFILALMLGVAFSNCIFDTNLQRPICLNGNGSRITWSEYCITPLETKYQIATEILTGVSNGSYSLQSLNASEAKEILSKLGVNVTEKKNEIKPIKKCDSLEVSWNKYCYMMNNGNDLIDCDHVDNQTKKEIVGRMWEAQGCSK